MKKSDVKIGMKVTPFKKTVRGWCNLESSLEWEQAQESKHNYLYVVEWDSGIKCWVLRHKIRGAYGGDFFNSSDFRPYAPRKKK